MSQQKVRGCHGHASGGSKILKKSGVPMDMPPAGQKSQKTRPWIYYGLIVRYRPLRQKLHPLYIEREDI